MKFISVYVKCVTDSFSSSTNVGNNSRFIVFHFLKQEDESFNVTFFHGEWNFESRGNLIFYVQDLSFCFHLFEKTSQAHAVASSF